MKRYRVSFELALDPNDPNGKHYVSDWIQRSIEENLSLGEAMTELEVEPIDKAPVPQYQHEQDCC